MPLFNTTYHIIQSLPGLEFLPAWEYCQKELLLLCRKNALKILKITVFLDHSDPVRFQQHKEILKKELLSLFGDLCPTFGIVAQSPGEAVLSFEVVTLTGFPVSYRRYLDYPYTLVEKEDLRILFASGLDGSKPDGNTESNAKESFEKAVEILRAEDMNFDQVVRQWNYVGNILHKEKRNGLLLQHYQLFNEVRNLYYTQYRTGGNFPAATGIGSGDDGMTIDLCAVKPSSKIKIFPINSPIQLEPYHYSQKVLVGSAANKTAPQFERAKIVMNEGHSTIFISGTASIIGQQTIGQNDVREQTRVTIENIESLISDQNLRYHVVFPKRAGLKKEYRYLRVYVKESADIPLVKTICEQHFGKIPCTYVQSDICRNDLLVEIEGEIFLASVD